MKQLLSDVKVLDLTHYIAGPYCTKLLADYGADVIKIEKPNEGDGARYLGPFAGGVPHPEKSGLFLHLNTNKRGVTLNLKSQTGKKLFKKLIKDADILVESFSPKVMPGFGLDYKTLEQVNPRLVMTSISNFGQTGPYRDYKLSELILSGMGHAMHTQGDPEREPIKMAGNLMQYQSGLVAAVLTMVALTGSRLSGAGQYVDVSMFETQVSSIDRRVLNLVGHAYCPTEVSTRQRVGQGEGFPLGNYPCKDGYISIVGAARYGFWPRVPNMLGMPELLNDPRFSTVEAQEQHPENREAFMEIFRPWCMEHTMHEITMLGQSVRALVAPVYNAKDLVNDEHMEERGSFVEVDHPMTGKVKYPGAPFRPAVAPFQIKRPAPLLGQHNEEILRELGHSKEDLVNLKETGVI